MLDTRAPRVTQWSAGAAALSRQRLRAKYVAVRWAEELARARVWQHRTSLYSIAVDILSTTVEDFTTRLELIMRQFGSVAELARAIGVSDNAIYKWLAGRGQPSLPSVVAIARAAGVSVEWLATGRESIARAGGPVSIAAAGDYAFMPRGEIRVGGRRGTRMRSSLIVDVLAFGAGWLEHRLAADAERLMLLEVSGDSMAPTLREGDLVLADLRETRARIDGVYVLREQNDLVVKRLQRQRFGAALTIRSDNPAYQPIAVSPGGVSIVGRVIWTGKAL